MFLCVCSGVRMRVLQKNKGIVGNVSGSAHAVLLIFVSQFKLLISFKDSMYI